MSRFKIGIRMCAATCIVAFALVPAPCFADGKFFSSLSVADDPAIASQRAIIVYRDGRQTLVVQSNVETESDTVGWILPLPAIPDEIAPSTPGVLQTMSELVQPRFVTSRDSRPLQWIAILLLIATLIAHSIVRRGSRARRAATFALAFLLTLAVPIVFLPALSTARGLRSGPGLDILATTSAGAYDVTVLRGESGAVVREWLLANGFGCDDEAERALDDYVADGWVFAAASFARIDDGPMSHHPLKVTFPIEQPVYPMRLTGVGAEALALDLYVFADARAIAPALDVWQCDRMKRFDEYESNLHNRLDVFPDAPLEKSATVYRGEHHRFRIGHPEIVKLLWDGCVFTHLRATLQPETMTRDVDVAFADFQSAHKRFFVGESARQIAITSAAGAVAFILLTLGLLGLGPLPRSAAARWLAAGAYALAALLTFALPMFLLPRIEVTSQPHRHMLMRTAEFMAATLDAELQANPERDPLSILATLGIEDAHSRFRDIPGGCTATRLESGGWEITAYDDIAAPVTIIVQPELDAEPEPGG